MNALLNAIATGVAHALALATFTGATTQREGKGKHRTGPHRKAVLRVETSHPFSPNVSARAASEPSDARQPHATASAWMRADR